jgi:hypothetical protein
MLFNYQYVTHDIEKLQTWLDHLVKRVWCRSSGVYSIDLLHPDLKDVILEIYNTEEDQARARTGDWLFGPIKRIDALFQSVLASRERAQIAAWYDHNNDIKALCACDPVKLPATYNDLSNIHADLAEEMEKFCTSLWSNVLGLSPVQKRIGEIDEHYKAFVAINKAGKCPYCGYNDIKGTHHNRREAYDHFLPKGTYPFNSVNFQNLAPMCHECNSSYKLQLDVTRNIDPIKRKNTGVRRKAFYTYAATPSISLTLTLNTADVTKLIPGEIDLQISAAGHDEEVEGWREVFGIDERYKAKCCGENDGKAWLQHIIEECANPSTGLTPDALLALNFRAADRAPYDGANFLKKPFLEACKKAGLI